MQSGILVVDKPKGMTSHQVVGKIRRLSGVKRVGHTGTLDPDVSGVLPICIGSATRLSEYMLEQQKGYEAKVCFGYSTDTQDASGEILESVSPGQVRSLLTEEMVRKALLGQAGEQWQTPPAFSAVKVAGKRAYDLARQGKEVQLSPRKITIYEIEMTGWNVQGEYPEAAFRVKCSKGTYIRTLCHDLGQTLHVPAHMSGLVRIQSGPFTLADAHSLQEIAESAEQGNLHRLMVSGTCALPHVPLLEVADSVMRKVLNGQTLTFGLDVFGQEPGAEPHGNRLVQIVDESGELRAIYERVDQHAIRPVKVLKE